MPASDRDYPSVWARPPRKERSTLTREQIVRSALELLDAEGLEALSMRKLAARLETGATTIYWHVANRDELIELVVNEVYGELEVPEGDDVDWREATWTFAQSARAAALRHRWTVGVLDHLVAAYPGPNLTAASERMFAIFEAGGFSLAEAERALGTVTSYVLGQALSEAAWHNWMERHGQTQEEWIGDLMEVAERQVQDDERLRAVMDTYRGKNPQEVMDGDFAYGLARLLDGLQAHLDSQRDR